MEAHNTWGVANFDSRKKDGGNEGVQKERRRETGVQENKHRWEEIDSMTKWATGLPFRLKDQTKLVPVKGQSTLFN